MDRILPWFIFFFFSSTEGRLAALLQKLNTVSEKKTALEEAEKNNKIAELYDMVTSNQPMAASLPDIVDRLESLQALHDQALNFNRTLVELDSYQQKLESNLSGNQKALEDTKEKFTENIQTIQKNFELMDQRLSKLKKWFFLRLKFWIIQKNINQKL